jgi:hypothetical protein
MNRASTTSLHTARAGTPTSWQDLVATTVRTPAATAATVYSNSNQGIESARPLKTMVPGSTTLQSHQQGLLTLLCRWAHRFQSQLVEKLESMMKRLL